jgi:rare lipoprotein A (peptidoglycan hydrolase)
MQRRRAVRNAIFLLAACATAQAAGLEESSARTSPGTRHDLSTRLKVRHAGLSGGIASVYSGRGTASGERMNPGALTAAHPSLPFGTKVRVTNSHRGAR